MLTFLALLPCILLMIYIYKKDKVEKEPIRLLILVFIAGIISTIPAMIFEDIGDGILLCLFNENSVTYAALSMIVVALVEEIVKFFAAKTIWKKPDFNCLFDGIVYCVFAALGFAALENVLYVLDGGIGIALVRGVISVPSHACDGIVMGYFFGWAKLFENRGDIARSKRYRRLAVLVPAAEHFIFDFCLTISVSMLLWLAFVIAFDIIAFFIVKKTAENDRYIV